MHKFTVGENMECFLTSYEQVCAGVELNREHWSYPLLFLIPSKVSDVLDRLHKEQFEDYESAKTALFKRCGVAVCNREGSEAPVVKGSSNKQESSVAGLVECTPTKQMSWSAEKPEVFRKVECKKRQDESPATVIVDHGTIPTHRKHCSFVGKGLAETVVTVSAWKAQQELEHVKSDVFGGLKSETWRPFRKAFRGQTRLVPAALVG